MKKILLALALLASSAHADVTLTSSAGVSVRTCNHNAGAICSVTWKGKEFINDYDHGRQLQSAVSFNKMGEAYNPTEAGSNWFIDGYNPSASSSILLGEYVFNGVLTTSNYMAFWNPVNGVRNSGHLFKKRLQFINGSVLKYDVEYTAPRDSSYSFGQYEALTGYMTGEFSSFWKIDVKNAFANPVYLDSTPGEQRYPVILSTQDQNYAMGIYSPDLPQDGYLNAGYGRWNHYNSNQKSSTMKWNAVFRINNPDRVQYFRMYVFIGSLKTVSTQMKSIHRKFHDEVLINPFKSR